MAVQTILVPLDGSELAESALKEALVLAKALAAEVIFLQVIPVAEDVIRQGATTITIDEQWQARKEQALQYLNRLRHRPEWSGVVTHAEIDMGNPAEMIIDYSRRHKIDRIVIATHGRTGLGRWVFGSVADKVLRAADRTVVLVRAGTENAGV